MSSWLKSCRVLLCAAFFVLSPPSLSDCSQRSYQKLSGTMESGVMHFYSKTSDYQVEYSGVDDSLKVLKNGSQHSCEFEIGIVKSVYLADKESLVLIEGRSANSRFIQMLNIEDCSEVGSSLALTKGLSLVPHDDCDLVLACSKSEAPDECVAGLRKLVSGFAKEIEQGDASRAHLAATLVQYTDGEVAAELLASLSYLLPDQREVLAEVMAKNPHLYRWTRTIVDPVPDLREIDDRCEFFSEILSSTGDVSQSGEDGKIDHWAKESYQLYQCGQ